MFHKYKKPITIDEVDIKKIVLSSKESYGNKCAFKYFIGYISNDYGNIPLCIRLPQMNASVKYFKHSKCMNLLVRDKELLKKYIEIWDKVKNLF